MNNAERLNRIRAWNHTKVRTEFDEASSVRTMQTARRNIRSEQASATWQDRLCNWAADVLRGNIPNFLHTYYMLHRTARPEDTEKLGSLEIAMKVLTVENKLTFHTVQVGNQGFWLTIKLRRVLSDIEISALHQCGLSQWLTMKEVCLRVTAWHRGRPDLLYETRIGPVDIREFQHMLFVPRRNASHYLVEIVGAFSLVADGEVDLNAWS